MFRNPPVTPPPIEIRDVTLADSTGRAILTRVSVSIRSAESCVLVGGGDGPRELLRCVAGERRVDTGTISVSGLAPRKARRRLGRRLLVLGGGDVSFEPDAFDLAIATDPSEAIAAKLAAGSGTVLVATSSAEIAAVIGGRIAIFRRERLVAEGRANELAARFRLIRYVNRLTESRTVFGTELDEFHGVRVRVRGWGIEAVVSDFRQEAFERLRGMDGVEDASAEAMSLREIVEAVTGS